MSSTIWTQCAGGSEIRQLRLLAWRAVEAQHQISTRKLVDTADEQLLLEELIDRVKPPYPAGVPLHYLLSTPFRYPPLRYGSRFGGRHERGIWYGAESPRTVFAEVAYYRLLFLEGTAAALAPLASQLTLFNTRVRSPKGIDLTQPPFAAFHDVIASATSYAASQALGTAMRAAGVELFQYPSVRDPEVGTNIGAFAPSVFGSAKPKGLETWQCIATRGDVEITKRDYFSRSVFLFPRDVFLVAGALPAPAL